MTDDRVRSWCWHLHPDADHLSGRPFYVYNWKANQSTSFSLLFRIKHFTLKQHFSSSEASQAHGHDHEGCCVYFPGAFRDTVILREGLSLPVRCTETLSKAFHSLLVFSCFQGPAWLPNFSRHLLTSTVSLSASPLWSRILIKWCTQFGKQFVAVCRFLKRLNSYHMIQQFNH